MKPIQTSKRGRMPRFIWALIVCALVATIGVGSGMAADKGPKVTLVYDHALPNVPGKSMKGVLVATTVTGFFFPFHGFTPAIGLGIISLPFLALTIYARYPKRLGGAWRWIYAIGAVICLYFNVFVLVVQSFEKVPALHAIAPTQTESPFKLTQLAVLIVSILLGIVAVVRFRPESARA